MEFDIIEEKKNELLSREELKIEVKHSREPTPTRLDVLSAVCAKKNFDKKLTLLKKFATLYGTNKSRGTVLAYETEEAMNRAESPKIVAKSIMADEPKTEKKEEKSVEPKEEKAEPEKKEDKPAEPKEEKKVESKEKAEPEKKESEEKKSSTEKKQDPKSEKEEDSK